jgi:glycolate oxidase FAD binding subunit
MTDVLKARDAKDVEDAVVWALAEGKRLDVVGQSSKHGIGRPSQTDLTLDVSDLSGVTLYEPEELVLSARAGTPLAQIEALVAEKGQELAFEPLDYGPVLGLPAGRGTVGGMLACNLAGPRRIKAGAARDHFLGVMAVSGRGETFKSGGRVVKNVTGYDLCKLLAGSFGTLAVMTDVTIKTLPRAESEASVTVFGLDDAQAMRAMSEAMGSSCEVSGAAHLPSHIAGHFDGLRGTAQAVTVLRLEGVAPSIAHRKGVLAAIMKSFGPVDVLDQATSRTLWRGIRDALPFSRGLEAERTLWRLSVPPARGFELAEMISTGAEMFYDWAGGLIWVAMPRAEDGGALHIRDAMAILGGHATLIRAPAAMRATVDVFEPQESGVAALTKRVKDSFDPKGLLNPGRMWAGV